MRFGLLVVAVVLCFFSPSFLSASFSERLIQGVNRSPGAPRTVQRFPDRTIDAQIRPTDKEIELINYDEDPALLVLDAHGKVLETLAKSSELVGVIRIKRIESEITSDRTWVTSTVAAKVVDLWKTDPEAQPFVDDGRLRFAWDGGTVTVDGVTVRARRSWADQLREGRSYLVFGLVVNGEFRIPQRYIYELIGSRLRPTFVGGRDDIARDTIENLKARAKSVTQSH